MEDQEDLLSDEQWSDRLKELKANNQKDAEILLTAIQDRLCSVNTIRLLPLLTHIAYYVTLDEDIHELNFAHHLREVPVVHFLCGLILQMKDDGREKPDIDPKEMYDLVEDCTSYLLKMSPLSIGNQDDSSDIDKYFVMQGHKQTSKMVRPINPERYPYQTKNFIKEIDRRISDIFKRKFELTPNDFFEVGTKIKLHTENRVNNVLEDKINHPHIKIFLEDTDTAFKNTMQFLESEEQQNKYFDFYCRYLVALSAMESLIFTIDDIKKSLQLDDADTKALKRYLALCSNQCGDQPKNSDVLIDNVLLYKPLIRWGNQYFCPAPADLTSALPLTLEKLLDDEKIVASRIWDRYQKAKANFVEDKAREFLERIFPKSNVLKNVLYNSNGNIEEVDVLIPYDNKLIIIQAKSGSLNSAAKRGAEESIKKAIKRLIEDAYQQGTKVRKYIQNNPNPVFTLKDGSIVFSPDSATVKKLDYVFINLTLEPLGILSAKIKDLQSLGFFKESEYPISMSIYDLETITEILPPSPSVFIHYLKERIFSQNESLFHFQDELTAFGWYLETGGIRKPSGEEYETIDWITLDTSYVHGFDDYYLRNGEKPLLKTNPDWIKLIMHIEAMRQPLHTQATERLLNLSHRMQNTVVNRIEKIFNKKAKKGSIGVASLAAIDEPVGVTFIIDDCGRVELSVQLEAFCQSRKYQARKNEWVGLAKARRSNGPWWTITCIQLHDLPWSFNPKMENIGRSFIEGAGL